ncbi:hypothetical protein ASPACDRAFT_126492 [Aspergillus aculeatus ATCC 16872]|uniref:Cyclin-D1-binding protein 1-like N-terminal domain-containing protein n=1 Tax=Aspergillus aculeatus (strain ATCC 16872 / CBS 172.66 / WB 5094) TaxID=690307 RepID=A0A1L9WHV6_ASPA1|nr:uncharacterized protein ASPACDRAFT_126492 [Aspergillus aculeatus ATCC 16872]OJJ95695.1 hypothetical protein ASPACDRAFT_126492 [Aspergillus aculeatus ATCC 16872]
MAQKLHLTLTTTLTLLDQFQTAITTSNASSPSPTTTTTETIITKDALPLLSASSLSLKSQITKLSLVSITAPFTPTAAVPILTALNESVLPSLVTAALLITATDHTQAFQTEAHALTRLALTELAVLLKEVQRIASRSDAPSKKGELAQPDKDAVTLAAARAWESCDALVDLAAKGVVGFVVRRVEQWRDLVRDAVGEIEEWDPDEEGDEFFDELLSDDDGDEEDDAEDTKGEAEDEEESKALHAQKKSTLRVLKPIAQVYPAIVTHRLKKTADAVAEVGKLEALMENLRLIPELVDEVAGALYEANPDKSGRFLGQTKDRAVTALELVKLPWQQGTTGEEKGDKFTTWVNTWLKVMSELSKSVFESA